MAKKSQHVQVGKRRLEISNLSKLLYPDDEISKAEVIHYYLTVAPTILAHLKGRPLSLVRFPGGIYDEKFFQKNRPEWAPDWLEYVTLGSEDKKDYILATEEASLAWLANLACLELHQMHAKGPHFDRPNYIVYDIDPPEGYDFKKVVKIATHLKEHIERYGYTTFVKTTGGKGVHLLTPILPQWSFEEAFKAAQEIARPFVEGVAEATLHIKKEARKGRVLIDIYRNRSGQTIIGAYSLRGNPGAPVSTPLTWQELSQLEDPKAFHARNVPQKVLQEGDAWDAFASYAVPLHTKETQKSRAKRLKASPHRKTPDQLEQYSKKRDFTKTPEPQGLFEGGNNSGFVVHRHHASHLHYDLRLEQDGVLRSWAVPRGLPPRPGVKRLAVATEDHPMKYITFEGEIPKGQYGGGMMWIYANGKYEITKEKKDGFYFTLSSKEISAEYRMHLMKDNEWLLERVDSPQVDWVTDEIQPMLAEISEQVPAGEEYIYEMKWDGIRALVALDEGELNIWSRKHKSLNRQFPELMIPKEAFRVNSALFDAEIVCFDPGGKPDFKTVIHRMQRTGDMEIERATQKYPAFCYLFDCLYLDGRSLVNEPLMRRRAWISDSLKHGTAYRMSEGVEDGPEFFEAVKKMGLEGIIAKDRNSRYLPGKRSTNWLKVKVRHTADVLILGYTEGKGNREMHFGALHLGEWVNGTLAYRGKVGTGFTGTNMQEVVLELDTLKRVDRMVEEKPLDNHKTTWVEPVTYCEIQYASITKNSTFREPVFVRLRPDLR